MQENNTSNSAMLGAREAEKPQTEARSTDPALAAFCTTEARERREKPMQASKFVVLVVAFRHLWQTERRHVRIFELRVQHGQRVADLGLLVRVLRDDHIIDFLWLCPRRHGVSLEVSIFILSIVVRLSLLLAHVHPRCSSAVQRQTTLFRGRKQLRVFEHHNPLVLDLWRRWLLPPTVLDLYLGECSPCERCGSPTGGQHCLNRLQGVNQSFSGNVIDG
mmetsp:Transcript_5652/g.16135  ORF Transcript_5652/g.16135 Transcript_5652/m.16135 type:complete len:219 (-) Transcript_5652:186-842(-)